MQPKTIAKIARQITLAIMERITETCMDVACESIDDTEKLYNAVYTTLASEIARYQPKRGTVVVNVTGDKLQ